VRRVFRSPCATILFLALALASTTPMAARAGDKDGVREEPQPGQPGYQELALAFARLAKGDYDGALKYAQRARSLAPAYEMPVRLLADILNKLGRTGEAVGVINDFVASHKHSMALIAQRGHLRKRLMDVAGAETDLRSARDSGALTQEQAAAVDVALFDLAMSAAYKDFNESRLNEAIEKARAAHELDKKAEAPVGLIAEAFSRQGRAQAALDELNRYISQNKASGRLLAQRGYLRRAMQDLKGAAADFEAALAAPDIDPSQTSPLRNALAEAVKAEHDSVVQAELAAVYAAIAKRDYARAVKAARDLRAKYPNAEAPLFALMTALTKSRQAKAAVKEADAFIKDNKPSSTLLAQRGYSRRAIGDLSGAIEDFKAALAQPDLEPAQVKRLKLALAEAERANEPGGSQVGAQATPLQQALNSGYGALKVGRLDEAVRAAREAHDLDPKAEEPVLLLLTALLRQGCKAEALAEANRYLASFPQSPRVLAQRGFMRRQARDVSGAVADFEQALKYDLPADQKLNVIRALDEARYTLVAEKAFKALAARDWVSALRYGRAAEAFPRADEAVFRVTIAALAGLGHTAEALHASNALIARGKATGQAYAQRAYLRKTLGDAAGALADFVTAIDRGGLPPAQRVAVELEIATARSSAFEKQGDVTRASAELVDFVRSHPDYADGWSTLGQFHARQKEYPWALSAFESSLAIERRGEVLLNAGYASVYVDRSKESQFFREAIDRWSSDPSLRTRPARDREVVRTQIVEADSSVRTNLVFNGMADRPKRWGGYQVQPSFETTLRFDGRHLPSFYGLESFVGGFWSQDRTRFTEGYSRFGLRLRPIDGVNFSVSAEWQHHFTKKNVPYNQLVLSWGYGYGGFAYSSAGSAGAAGALEPAMLNYPHESASQPLVSIATYGTYRVGEHRYLQNGVGLLGYSYWDANSRTVLGAAAMGMGAYDSADTRRFAFGVGPAIVARAWLGGDYYRAYDAILSIQIGYLFPFGESRRQGGLNTTIGISF
jgi:tetratricopeptide (TPR) repeat protein